MGSSIAGSSESSDRLSRARQGGSESRASLAKSMAATADVDVKRRILRAFMVAGAKDRLLTAAQSEQNADLRAEAVQQLGRDGRARRAVAAVSEGNGSRGQEADHPGDVRRRERRRGSSSWRRPKRIPNCAEPRFATSASWAPTARARRSSRSTTPTRIRRSGERVIKGLFVQGNATALVDLARKEQDPSMKKDIVQKLSVMGRRIRVVAALHDGTAEREVRPAMSTSTSRIDRRRCTRHRGRGNRPGAPPAAAIKRPGHDPVRRARRCHRRSATWLPHRRSPPGLATPCQSWIAFASCAVQFGSGRS